jgi:hypothetical protein
MNFQYDSALELYTADLIFHENSSDTFKTLGIYTFERIPAFQFADPDIRLEKFQLFNEYGINITGNAHIAQQVSRVEAVNNDAKFRSKWIHGDDFEKKFPVGSEIRFEDPLFEFTNRDRTYTVVSSKKGAVMVISDTSNYAFNISYGTLVGLTASYDGKSVSGINSVGIHNYISATSSLPLFSVWSEPLFYSMLYNGRKLNLINTEKNDSVVTVKNKDIVDKIYYEYTLPASSFSQSSDLWMEVSMRTDLPVIYQGGLTVSTDKLHFFGDIPEVLQPGVKFRILSTLNDNVYQVRQIDDFRRFNTVKYFQVGDQVKWDSRIYQCVLSFTWSATSSITPADQTYWTTGINYLPVTQMSAEVLADTQLYLNSNTFYFETRASSSTASNQNELTLASCVDRWSDDLSRFNINLKFEDSTLKASLLWASEYATVRFYKDSYASASNLVGTSSQIVERTIETVETLRPEFNRDLSEQFRYRVMFTDLDQYGMVLTFNGQPFQQEIQWVYDGLVPDIPRTIDKTVRAWVTNNSLQLLRAGVVCRVDYSRSEYPFVHSDSISFYTFYPNVPIEFEVSVGTTAEYFIAHSDIEFAEIGPELRLNINGRQYQTIFGSQSLTVSEKVDLWIEDHANILDDYGIYVRAKAGRLFIDVKQQDRRVQYEVYIGRTPLPGENSFRVNRYLLGNIGPMVTSNAVILQGGPTVSTFFDVNGASAGVVSFATGMVTSINNSVYPYNNQEYNLIEVNKDRVVLSYQGPYWGGTSSRTSSPFVSIAFDTGFSQSLTPGPSEVTGLDPGAYTPISYNQAFDTWRAYSYLFVGLPADSEPITDLKDIVYLPTTRKVYVYGTNIKTYNAVTGNFTETIKIPGMSTPVKLLYNDADGHLYAVTTDFIHKVNPSTNGVVSKISLGFTATSATDLSAAVNPHNGDIFVSCASQQILKVLKVGTLVPTTVYSSSACYGVAVDTERNRVFVITASDTVRQFDGNTLTQTATYAIPGSTSNNEIAYSRSDDGMYVVGTVLSYITNGTVQTYPVISSGSFNSLLYDNVTGTMLLSRNSLFSSQVDGQVDYNLSTTKYGYMVVNQYDERVFMSAQSSYGVYVIDPRTGFIVNKIEGIPSYATRMAFNSDRGSVWCILPGTTQVIEIGVELQVYYRYGDQITTSSVDNVFESQYGTLAIDYTEPGSLWLSTRDYIRKPRMNFLGEPQAKMVWKWETDDKPEFFLYDFSGDQLDISGPYAYIGEKPLTNIHLNKKPNRDVSKVGDPASQQTVFNEVVKSLDYINSSYNISFSPTPLECFVGYNTEVEGTNESTLMLYLREDVTFKITPTSTNNDSITFTLVSEPSFGGEITLNEASTSNFLVDGDDKTRGLRVGQVLRINVNDVTNKRNKYVSLNSGLEVTIRELYLRRIVVSFNDSVFTEESTVLNHNGVTTYLSVDFTVMDKSVAQVMLRGQTEIEDPRYEINLGNVGKLVASNDVFIFKTYDINEQGIDWGFLNRKRKEMLMVKDQIYPFIGSYKAIINAINYFGYNDLELYEYYRNVNLQSPDYGKLFKFEVPDIFDNTVPGWRENDWIRWTLPNPNVEDTNLFNLTYRITDRDGNNVLMYSLAEVITKLMGLKRWLESNVIPISHRILDITGRADFVQVNSVVHKSYAVKSYRIDQSMSPVDPVLNEAYLMPVNSGSSVYNCVIDFNCENKDYIPTNFELRVKTYKTYSEWQPFKTYQRGQIVSYFQQNYESARDQNRLNDPRKYSSTEVWSSTFDYTFGQIVEYNRNIYVYGNTFSSMSVTASNPYIDQINGYGNWTDITEWRPIDYVPVQNIREYRTGTHSFNFALDTNIDPYVSVEVTSENGYGLTWTSRKTFEIRGILGLEPRQEEVDTPGPIKIWDKLTTTTTTTTVRQQYIDFWEAISSQCVDE